MYCYMVMLDLKIFFPHKRTCLTVYQIRLVEIRVFIPVCCTVKVGPLLALILADGNSLVTQVIICPVLEDSPELVARDSYFYFVTNCLIRRFGSKINCITEKHNFPYKSTSFFNI